MRTLRFKELSNFPQSKQLISGWAGTWTWLAELQSLSSMLNYSLGGRQDAVWLNTGDHGEGESLQHTLIWETFLKEGWVGRVLLSSGSDNESFPGGAVVKNPCTVQETWGDAGLTPGSGRSSGAGNDNPLQYSCLDNPMDIGAWWATVHAVAKSWTWLSE